MSLTQEYTISGTREALLRFCAAVPFGVTVYYWDSETSVVARMGEFMPEWLRQTCPSLDIRLRL
jgi:hypothetical protein